MPSSTGNLRTSPPHPETPTPPPHPAAPSVCLISLAADLKPLQNRLMFKKKKKGKSEFSMVLIELQIVLDNKGHLELSIKGGIRCQEIDWISVCIVHNVTAS